MPNHATPVIDQTNDDEEDDQDDFDECEPVLGFTCQRRGVASADGCMKDTIMIMTQCRE